MMQHTFYGVYGGLILILLLAATACKPNYTDRTHPSSNIGVHDRGRYLQTQEGAPFFYLADTGWELFHKLTRDEALMYLTTRKNQGFNVIQAVAIAELQGLSMPNAYGDTPLLQTDNGFVPDTTRGNAPTDSVEYDYWDHVETIIRMADSLGLYVGLLPCWGEYVTPRFMQKVVFSNPKNGYQYGHFIATRLRSLKNIIWILGGDRLPNEHQHGIETWRAMAEGIADGTNGEIGFDYIANYASTLMTYHCFYPSSIWFEKDAWIDFHMWGSYHEKKDNDRAFEITYYQWQLKHIKPTLNGEPPYENGSVNYDPNFKNGFFDDFDVRQQAYWSVFAGACGHTYGCNKVWRFYDPAREKTLTNAKDRSWKDELTQNGALQLQYLKKLIESEDFFIRTPAQDILVTNTHDPTGHLQATKGNDFAFVYIPTGKNVEILMGKIAGDSVSACWYNPRNGSYSEPVKILNKGTVKFDPPGNENRGNDWVLVLKSIIS